MGKPIDLKNEIAQDIKIEAFMKLLHVQNSETLYSTVMDINNWGFLVIYAAANDAIRKGEHNG